MWLKGDSPPMGGQAVLALAYRQAGSAF